MRYTRVKSNAQLLRCILNLNITLWQTCLALCLFIERFQNTITEKPIFIAKSFQSALYVKLWLSTLISNRYLNIRDGYVSKKLFKVNFIHFQKQISILDHAPVMIDIDRYTNPHIRGIRIVLSNGGEQRRTRREENRHFIFGKRGNVIGQGSGTNFPAANRYFNKRISAAHYR